MSTALATTCDVCTKQKGITNHWWTVLLNVGSQSIEIIHFDPLRTSGQRMDVCGHQCVIQVVARFLDHGNLLER